MGSNINNTSAEIEFLAQWTFLEFIFTNKVATLLDSNSDLHQPFLQPAGWTFKKGFEQAVSPPSCSSWQWTSSYPQLRAQPGALNQASIHGRYLINHHDSRSSNMDIGNFGHRRFMSRDPVQSQKV